MSFDDAPDGCWADAPATTVWLVVAPVLRRLLGWLMAASGAARLAFDAAALACATYSNNTDSVRIGGSCLPVADYFTAGPLLSVEMLAATVEILTALGLASFPVF